MHVMVSKVPNSSMVIGIHIVMVTCIIVMVTTSSPLHSQYLLGFHEEVSLGLNYAFPGLQ